MPNYTPGNVTAERPMTDDGAKSDWRQSVGPLLIIPVLIYLKAVGSMTGFGRERQ